MPTKMSPEQNFAWDIFVHEPTVSQLLSLRGESNTARKSASSHARQICDRLSVGESEINITANEDTQLIIVVG